MSAVVQLKTKPGHRADPLTVAQQFPEANRMEAIGRMVGGVAHDFNNLLTGMVLCSELILAGLDRDSRLRRFAEEIRCAGGQGAGLIQQLLAVARQRPVESKLLGLNQVIAEVRTLLTRLIGENIELVSELADDLGLVEMDPAQVQQVVLNLVLNARDAMPDGGRIVIRTRNLSGPRRGIRRSHNISGSWVEFEVIDNGCGMDVETHSRLFEPFFSTKKPGQGNGLGLATVHRIVTQQGGRIQVESQVGKGTRVLVKLPRAEARLNLESAQHASPNSSPRHPKIRTGRPNKSKRSKSV